MKDRSDREVTLEDVFPILAVRDGFIVSRRGDVTMSWELTLPEAFTVLGPDYDAMHRAFCSAVLCLPPWTMVHRQDIYHSGRWRGFGASSFLGKAYERHFVGRRVPMHTQYLHLTFSSKSSALSGASSCGLYGQSGEASIPDEATLTRMRSKGDEFISILLGTRHIRARRLGDDDYLETKDSPGLLHSYLNLFTESPLLSQITRHGDALRIGRSTVWGYAVSESDHLPPAIDTDSRVDRLSDSLSEVRLSWASATGIQLACPHMVNSMVLTLPQRETLSELMGRRNRMGSMSVRSPENRVNGEEINEFAESASRDGLTVVRAHTNLLVWGPASRSGELRSMASAALSREGIIGVQAIHDTPALWFSSMPGACTHIGEENLMLTTLDTAAAFAAAESYERGIPGGAIQICDRTRMIPVPMDFQGAAMKAGLVDNCNAFILGPSGTGKSFFTNYMLRNLYDRGEYVFVIDVGDSYEGLCRLIAEESEGRDGIYYRWEKGNVLSFDVLSGAAGWLDDEGRLQKTDDDLIFFETLLMAMWQPSERGWTGPETAILDTIIADFCSSLTNHPDPPVFDDFARFCTETVRPQILSPEGYDHQGSRVTEEDLDFGRFCNAMSSFSRRGGYAYLLNGTKGRDLAQSRFTVVEISGISDLKDLYRICVLCMMQTFKKRMRNMSSHDFKCLVIDEAWKAISTPAMAPFLTELWKTARKFNGSAIVVTQEIQDIMSNPVVKDTILQNSSARILLNQEGNDIAFDQLCAILALGPRERNLVRSMEKAKEGRWREVFIALGRRKCGVFATEVSPEEAVVYESRLSEKERFLTMARSVGVRRAVKSAVRSASESGTDKEQKERVGDGIKD